MKSHIDIVAETTRAGIISVVVNGLLFALKLLAGISIGSVAIVVDAWHTLSDSLTSFIVIIGARIAGKPGDEEHPFGHQRAEWIAALVIAVLLSVVAINFAYESIKRLREGGTLEYGWLGIAVLLVSTLGKELLAQYCFFVCRRTQSESLRADGWHHRSDALSSLLILIGVLLGRGQVWLDAVLGMLVAVMIFLAAISLLRRVGSLVLGESPSSQLVQDLSAIANRVSGRDVRLHHVHQHVYGDHREVTMHIRLDNDMSVADAHVLLDRMKADMRSELHVEPTILIEPLEMVVCK